MGQVGAPLGSDHGACSNQQFRPVSHVMRVSYIRPFGPIAGLEAGRVKSNGWRVWQPETQFGGPKGSGMARKGRTKGLWAAQNLRRAFLLILSLPGLLEKLRLLSTFRQQPVNETARLRRYRFGVWPDDVEP